MYLKKFIETSKTRYQVNMAYEVFLANPYIIKIVFFFV